ncbi:MAG: dienelactone hydrolase family protein [Planctomycetes bacterium]|nr:dienelactone hydrolase family protein [Planctomycetota bacterium]
MVAKEIADRKETLIKVRSGTHLLEGILCVPPGSKGVVVFAHGSGSSRHSPRNQLVARSLQEAGLATLLIDLLEENEAENRDKVFDIELLANRLQGAADWLGAYPETRHLRLGYFGASTGAGSALVAAARQPETVGAVVSRGGRPDLAWDDLPKVEAPTLLIVGGNDEPVIRLNEQALAQLQCPCQLIIVPGATHLFSEPGTLENVAMQARKWFLKYLTHGTRGSSEDVSEEFGNRVPRSDMDQQC